MTAISINQGNDFSVVRFVQDNDGNAVDLTGQTVTSEVRQTASNASGPGVLVAALTATLTNAAAGEVTLSATAAETDAMSVGAFKYDIKHTDGTSVQNTTCAGFTVTGVVTE